MSIEQVVWELKQHTDVEGRFPPSHVAFFFKEEDARRAAAEIEPYGGVVERRILRIYHFSEWQRTRDLEAREKALSKLTPDEQRILGLTP